MTASTYYERGQPVRVVTEAQADLLRRANRYVPPCGETIQLEDIVTAGELSRMDLAKHVWRHGAYELVITPAGRSALNLGEARDE